MTAKFIRVHLIDGDVRESADASDLTDEQVKQYQDVVTNMMMTGADKGWEVSIDLPGAGWAVFPRSSVLYIELVGFGGSR